MSSESDWENLRAVGGAGDEYCHNPDQQFRILSAAAVAAVNFDDLDIMNIMMEKSKSKLGRVGSEQRRWNFVENQIERFQELVEAVHRMIAIKRKQKGVTVGSVAGSVTAASGTVKKGAQKDWLLELSAQTTYDRYLLMVIMNKKEETAVIDFINI